MPDAAPKSIMDRYGDAVEKLENGEPVTRREAFLILGVRAKETAVAGAALVGSILLIPVALVGKAGSYLKDQWRQAHTRNEPGSADRKTPPPAPKLQ